MSPAANALGVNADLEEDESPTLPPWLCLGTVDQRICLEKMT